MSGQVSFDDLKDWEKRQVRTFEKWCNIYLKKAGRDLIAETTLGNCFQTGVTLVQLLDALYSGHNGVENGVEYTKAKYTKNAARLKMQIHRLNNLSGARKMYEDIVGPKNDTKWTREQMEVGSFRMTMGMVWSLILHRATMPIDGENVAGKQGLLLWCQKQCKGQAYVDGKPTNFTKNFANGMVFNAILNRFYPEETGYNNLNPDDAADNLEAAFAKFEEKGVDRLLEVEDMLVEEGPDEKSVVTYVFEIFRHCAQLGDKSSLVDHLRGFLAFNRKIAGMCEEYERGSKEFLGFVESQVGEWAGAAEPASKLDATQAIETYKNWVKDTKPNQIVNKIDLETLYVNVQGELKINGRLPWDCPEDLSPDALEAATGKLTEAENAYADKIRHANENFIEARDEGVNEDTVKEIEQAFDHFDKDSNGSLNREEFFAAMVAMGAPVPEAEQEKLFISIAGEDARITRDEYVDYMVKFYDRADSAEALLGSLDKLGGDLSGLSEEEKEFLTSQIGEDGSFADYIKQSFP